LGRLNDSDSPRHGRNVSNPKDLLLIPQDSQTNHRVTLEIAAKHSSIRSVSIAAFFYLSSMLMFGISLKKLDVSIAYAVWASLGTALISLVGILFFGEDCHTKKIISLVLIVLGTVGLNMK